MSGSADTEERGVRMPYRPSMLDDQQSARGHRNDYRDQRAQTAYDAQAARYAAAQRALSDARARSGAGGASAALLGDAARADRVNARAQLYADDGEAAATADVVDGERAGARIPYHPSTLDKQHNDRVPRCDQRTAVQRIYAGEFGRREAAVARAQLPNERALNRTHAAAARDRIDVVRAEKELHARTYTAGNEEAYRHVANMQRSVLGYDDTAKKTLAALRSAELEQSPAMRAATAVAAHEARRAQQ